VLALPGLIAGDESTGLPRCYLSYCGYDVHGWGQGRNLGSRPGVGQGIDGGSNAWRLYEAVSGHKADRADGRRARIEPPPPAPTTSIYSRTDGIVAWQTSVEKAGPQSESIEVVAGHLGLCFHPAVLYALADRLAQPEGGWQPFQRSPVNAWMYPEPARRA
jgi:hypothetical protein